MMRLSFFSECIRIYPGDTVSKLFIKRCEHFKLNPPPTDWMGIWNIH